MMMSIVSQISIAALAGLLLWAAVSDATRMIIPNRIAASIAALWLGFAMTRLAAGVPGSQILIALAIGLGAFALGFFLFMARLAGGGDVKLFAAVALWAGPNYLLPFLLITLLSGGVLAVAFLALRTLRAMTAQTPPGIAAPGFTVALMVALKSECPSASPLRRAGCSLPVSFFTGCRSAEDPLDPESGHQRRNEP
jgi:prepilin peptidase CpaA